MSDHTYVSGVARPSQLPGVAEVITRAVSVFYFRMQNSWLEYSQLYAGNMVMWRMPVFPWFTKQNKEKIIFLIVTFTSIVVRPMLKSCVSQPNH